MNKAKQTIYYKYLIIFLIYIYLKIYYLYYLYYRNKNMLNLKIDIKTKCVFNDLKLNEVIDENILNKLIASDLLQSTSWSVGNITFENEREQLLKLKKKIKKNKLEVKYNKVKYGFGRVYPFGGMSLCSLRREIRQTLSYDKYVDIDMENCHPVILLQICENNGIECRYLKQYVISRKEILLEVQEKYNCSRDVAKKLFLRLSYLGSFDGWCDDNKIDCNLQDKLNFIQDFTNELKCISVEIIKNNPEILKIVNNLEKKNKNASVVSIYLQEKECLILEVVYNYLDELKIINKDCVLCFDGIMILKDKYNPDLLIKLNEYVLTHTGFKINFEKKEMNTHYLEELKLVNCILDDFETESIEFEKTHCKIINKSIYIKQTDINSDVIIFSKTRLREAYEHLVCGEDKNGKVKLFIDQWTTGNKNIRKYDDLNCFPYPLICPDNIFNTWTPFICEGYIDDYTPNKEGLNFFLNHIKILCGNEENVSDYFIKWIGQMIQYPSVKTICPTLISKEGAGKGSLIKLMIAMLGEKKVFETTNSSRDVWGEFNNKMTNSFLVNLNELSKKDTIESQGKIKGLITDKSLTINAKGKDQFEINSYHRFIITTNKEDPINTSQDDRRNLIIRSSDELIENKEYFIKLNLLLEDIIVVRTCYDYFKNIKNLNNFCSLPLPKTNYQENLKLLNYSVPEQFIMDFCSSNNGIIEVSSSELYELFLNFVSSNNIEYKITPLKFGVKISNLNISGIEKGIHSRTGNSRSMDVDKIKKHFNIIDNPFNDDDEKNEEAKYGIKIEAIKQYNNCELDFGI